MPSHISDDHFQIGEVIELGGLPFIKSEFIVYLDTKDSTYKRYTMYEGALVLQYWDGTEFKNV